MKPKRKAKKTTAHETEKSSTAKNKGRAVVPPPEPSRRRRPVPPQQLSFERPKTLPHLTFGLSLYPPMSDWLAEGIKDIENRPFAPPYDVIGRYVVIHTTKNVPVAERIEGKKLKQVCAATGAKPPKNTAPGCVIGVVRVDGYVLPSLFTSADESGRAHIPHPATRSPWASGPVCWQVSGARRLSKPIPLSGGRRVWRVPREIIDQILQEMPDLAWSEDERVRWQTDHMRLQKARKASPPKEPTQ